MRCLGPGDILPVVENWLSPLEVGERERVVGALARALAGEPDVRLAYLYGSFAAGSYFADIDVGVLLDPEAARDFARQARLTARLEEASGVHVPVDLRPLNDAPISFVGPIVQRGRLLRARDAGERIDFEARILSLWFDFLPTWRENARALFLRVAEHGR